MTEQQARDTYLRQKWARILRLSNDDQKESLQENVLFTKHLIENQNEWISKDYVGFLSYKAFRKMKIQKLDRFLGSDTRRPDAIFFTCPAGSIYSPTDHPHLLDLWNDICVKCLRIPFSEVAQSNLWMSTPRLMMDYIRFFNDELWPTVKRHPLSWTDANYKSTHSLEDIQRCNNGYSFYTHVPFLLERVPRNYFLSKHQDVICL